MDESRLLGVLDEAAVAVRQALDELDEWGPSGLRPGQYKLDLAADAAALSVLHGAGLAVMSEESGLTGERAGGLLAVVDPIDGSTNAHRGIAFYNTSICVLDAEGPLAALVVNQANSVRYAAVRGGGAERDGQPISPSGRTELSTALVSISGYPGRHPGWGQFRALGAAALEFCAVADGTLDAYMVVGRSTLYGWDYLGGMLICTEAGAVTVERDGQDLCVRDDTPRRPIVAGSQALVDRLLSEGDI
jgi:fructose-1,6-bisphosphatase/inositol monophosphatase family enzyme